MGPRLRGGPSPCFCSFSFTRPNLRPRSQRGWSANRCWRWSGDAVAQRPVSPAQQPLSLHRGLFPDLDQLQLLEPRNPGPFGLCTASFALKRRSPPTQVDLGG